MTEVTILSRDDVGTRIEALAVSAGQVQAEAHILAVSCLDHIREFGDYRNAVRLMNRLPKSVRKEALAVWFEEFSGERFTVRLNKDTGLYEGKLKERNESDFRIAEAAGTPFWEHTQEKRPGSTFTLEKLLATLKSKANNDKLNDDGTPKVDQAARDLAARLYNEAVKMASVPAATPAPTQS